MDTIQKKKEDFRLEAERLNYMTDALTIFSRRTTLKWLPEILSMTGIGREEITVMFELNIEPNQSLKQLSYRMMASSSNVSVLIQSMVEDGVVCRVIDPKDRRRILLSLSEKGQKLYNNAQEYLLDKYEDYLRDLKNSDRESLNEATLSMVEVMERILNLNFINREG
jgi:DNA-binding MarR family transcriptional regulator